MVAFTTFKIVVDSNYKVINGVQNKKVKVKKYSKTIFK